MAGVLQGRRVNRLEALPGLGPLKFTPELQLNVLPVGVAGSSTVIRRQYRAFSKPRT
ncbi:MAG: hypothetical protein PHT62_04940 [Desulfotomaculaceae bacterium]|nr:hypothetical protein [Desulfotomaculaceae bacterium]